MKRLLRRECVSDGRRLEGQSVRVSAARHLAVNIQERERGHSL